MNRKLIEKYESFVQLPKSPQIQMINNNNIRLGVTPSRVLNKSYMENKTDFEEIPRKSSHKNNPNSLKYKTMLS